MPQDSTTTHSVSGCVFNINFGCAHPKHALVLLLNMAFEQISGSADLGQSVSSNQWLLEQKMVPWHCLTQELMFVLVVLTGCITEQVVSFIYENNGSQCLLQASCGIPGNSAQETCDCVLCSSLAV